MSIIFEKLKMQFLFNPCRLLLSWHPSQMRSLKLPLNEMQVDLTWNPNSADYSVLILMVNLGQLLKIKAFVTGQYLYSPEGNYGVVKHQHPQKTPNSLMGREILWKMLVERRWQSLLCDQIHFQEGNSLVWFSLRASHKNLMMIR